MALSYTAILKVPNSSTFSSNASFIVLNQLSNSAAGPYNSWAALIQGIEDTYTANFGGGFTFTSVDDGTITTYIFLYDELTSDPAIVPDPFYGVPSDLVAFVTTDDVGTSFSASWLNAQICEDAGACRECPPSVNPEDATDCLECYQDEIPFCDTTITVLGLDDSTEYQFKIIDQATGRTYAYTATTDSNGEADLITDDFPAGLFTPYNGPFTISIFDSNGDPVTLTYGYVNYSCIEVTITNSTDYTP